jgi:hypothetical protein
MVNVIASSTAQLIAALQSAAPGTNIQLKPGAYTKITLNNINIAGDVTVTSADPTNLAVINDLTINNCNGITFTNLNFNPVANPGTFMYRITSSSDINFSNLNVYGLPNGSRTVDSNGFSFKSSSNCSVTNSLFYQLVSAIHFVDSHNVQANNNAFSNLWLDAIDGVSVTGIAISNNNFSNMSAVGQKLHTDNIEFWVDGTGPNSGISVLNNQSIRGNGSNDFHFLLVTDHSYPSVITENVMVSGNQIFGAASVGLVVGGANNVTISNNINTSYADAASRTGAAYSTDVMIDNNVTEKLYNQSNTNSTLSGNTISSPLQVPAIPVAANSTLYVGPVTESGAGGGTAAVSVTARDSAGAPIAGTAITLWISGSRLTNTFDSSNAWFVAGVTNDQGVFSATLTAVADQAETVWAMVDGGFRLIIRCDVLAKRRSLTPGFGRFVQPGHFCDRRPKRRISRLDHAGPEPP